MFINCSNEESQQTAIHKIQTFFLSLKLSGKPQPDILRYLLNNWYDNYNWELWGRTKRKEVSLSRTTMKVEAHWSILKRLYIFSFNRPSIDLLIYIFDSKSMRKFSDNYTALDKGLIKPW